MKNPIKELEKVVEETTGTALTLSPKTQGKWSGYLLQKKQKFEGDSLEDVCKEIATLIIDTRVAVEVTEKTKNKKPYKLA